MAIYHYDLIMGFLIKKTEIITEIYFIKSISDISQYQLYKIIF